MLVWLCAIFLVLGFIVISKAIGLIENGSRVFVVAQQSIGILQDANMDDLVKEKAIQGFAKELIKLFSLITIGSLIALMVPLGIVYLLSLFGIVSFPEVLELSLSWKFIALILIVSVLYFGWKRRVQ
jgi:hypothetical protein